MAGTTLFPEMKMAADTRSGRRIPMAIDCPPATTAGGGQWQEVQDPDPLAQDTWYFVAVTYDYLTGEMILYKNGLPVDSAFLPAEKRDVTDPTISVGCFGTNGYNWLGTIDDARIYNTVLSPEQIAAMYNSGSGTDNVMVSQETAAGEDWQCEVTPFSDAEMGVTQFSNTVTIAASAEVIIDDADAGFSSGPSPWPTSPGYVPGSYNDSYHFAEPGGGSMWAKWTFQLSAPGNCEIFAQWSSYKNRSGAAPYTILNNGTPVSAPITVDQR